MFKFLLVALLAASAQALPGVSVDAVLDEIRSAPIGWPVCLCSRASSASSRQGKNQLRPERQDQIS